MKTKVKNNKKIQKNPKNLHELLEQYKGIIPNPEGLDAVEYLHKHCR